MATIDDMTPVTLANCEDERIHLPGAIQPHGALIALDQQGRVLSRSANLAAIVGQDVLPGSELPAEWASGQAIERLCTALTVEDAWMDSCEWALGSTVYDVVGHRHGGVTYLEFEPRQSAGPSFSQLAITAQRIISQMQARNDLEPLLKRVTDEIRNLTGYDRVMAYRFRPDLSGEVIAEARRPDLESYLGQRYPASDIPAQARRLYIENPIRLIADVTYVPSPLVPALDPRTAAPFDLSHSILRSVSPIHCEYLTNMGIRASMSVSIVVDGKLWGLFSCHHMSAKTMPHPLRVSFQVVSQVCSALVERLAHNLKTETLALASQRQQALGRSARDSEDLLCALTDGQPNIADLVPCDGAAVALGGRVQSIGGQFEALSREVIEFLGQRPELETFTTDAWHGEHDTSAFCGVMAIRFHRQEGGWALWFRREEIHHVRWAGKPDKILKVGPSGARLTPRGSFEAWEEVVRGRSPHWSETDMAIAERLRNELVDVCLSRAGEIDGMRQRLIAMLGHDLRNPLQSISMAASMLTSSETRDTELRKHISHSSGRMERLISQILEMSRLQSGMGIPVACQDTDLSALVHAIVAETSVAFPTLQLQVDVSPDIHAHIDPDRYAQVVANLLANARHHGAANTKVEIALKCDQEQAYLSVTNQAATIAPERLANLFSPFKPGSGDNKLNKTGLGIGLYISQAIALAHRGKMTVEQQDGHITFCMSVPLGR